MFDKEKLRYDLALHAAVIMTLRDNSGIPTDRMLVNFELAYERYGDSELQERFNSIVEKITVLK